MTTWLALRASRGECRVNKESLLPLSGWSSPWSDSAPSWWPLRTRAGRVLPGIRTTVLEAGSPRSGPEGGGCEGASPPGLSSFWWPQCLLGMHVSAHSVCVVCLPRLTPVCDCSRGGPLLPTSSTAGPRCSLGRGLPDHWLSAPEQRAETRTGEGRGRELAPRSDLCRWCPICD